MAVRSDILVDIELYDAHMVSINPSHVSIIHHKIEHDTKGNQWRAIHMCSGAKLKVKISDYNTAIFEEYLGFV